MGPIPIEELITAFARLPGVGRVTAQRWAFYLLKSPSEEAEALARAIVNARENIHYCARCFNFTERQMELCHVCRDPRRDRQQIIVVEEASAVLYLERDQLVQGVYHVLGGVLSPIDGVHIEDIRLAELIERTKEEPVREVILALNASAEADATADYIARQLGEFTKVTRLARGLPVGADLDLADKMTLVHALEGRQSF